MTPSPPGLPSGLAAYDPARGYPYVVPCLLYDNVAAAAQWLTDVLGFREVVRATLPTGWTGHSELERHGFAVLLGRRGGQLADTASVTQVFVDDVDAVCAQVACSEGSVLAAPADMPWGVRQAVVRDPQDQRWMITRHLRDTDPATWYGHLLGPAAPSMQDRGQA